MLKYLFFLALVSVVACRPQKSIIRDNVVIDVYTYEDESTTKAAAMPEIKSSSSLFRYKRRFDYLLLNISEIHQPGKFKNRVEIFNLYPDTSEIKKRYLQKYAEDKKLAAYFEETAAPLLLVNVEIKKSFTTGELMEVASKFFYCDKVNADTSVQSHVCIGINGLNEAKWEKDYTLLAAFCYEAIFNDLDKDTSQIREPYYSEKKMACEQFRKDITTLDKYLENVRTELFKRMKDNAILKQELLAYYERNRNNLAFKIVK